MTLGNKEKFILPGNATEIMVKGQYKPILFWKSWKNIFSKSFHKVQNVCYRVTGTVFKAELDNSC